MKQLEPCCICLTLFILSSNAAPNDHHLKQLELYCICIPYHLDLSATNANGGVGRSRHGGEELGLDVFIAQR